MSQIDLETVIEDSIADSLVTEEATSTDETPEAPLEAPVEGLGVVGGSEAEETPAVEAEAPTEAPVAPTDDFDKKYGLQKETVPGRENRIPYSRVKKIVEKATKDAEQGLTPKIKDFETKVADYETRLEKVAKFEKIMVEEPERFISMLGTLPQYQAFFSALQQAKQASPVQTPTATAAPADLDAMPEPDKENEDGSKIYSMEGFKALQDWNRRKAREEVLAEVQKTYGPIQQSYEAQQQERQRQEYFNNVIVPQISAQIEKAKKWPLFNENEAEITKALDSDKSLTLEGAYQQVVLPKLISSRDQMRQDVIRELRKVPASTAVPSSGVKPNPQASHSGPRNLEDIIKESVETAGLSGR